MMVISKKLYTCGAIGEINAVIRLMKAGSCPALYFVYRTNNPRFLYQIAAFDMLKFEKDTPFIFGIAESKEYAFKIVCHILRMSEDK